MQNDRLTTIPGVGPRMEEELRYLGFTSVGDLQGVDPEAMYSELCRRQGRRVDPCVLYVFRCAVYYADNTVHDAELLKWWRWKDMPEGAT